MSGSLIYMFFIYGNTENVRIRNSDLNVVKFTEMRKMSGSDIPIYLFLIYGITKNVRIRNSDLNVPNLRKYGKCPDPKVLKISTYYFLSISKYINLYIFRFWFIDL